MRKIFSYVMLATVVVAAFSSCVKEETITPAEPTEGRKTITVVTKVQDLTKSTLDSGHSNLQWSTGDAISVFNNADTSNDDLTYDDGGYMTISVPGATTEIYGHYPYYSGNNDGPSNVSVYISNNQTQTNPGELNGYYYPMVAKGTVTADNKADMVFYPVAAALAINLYHTGVVGTEKVSKIKVTPTVNTNFIGRQYMDLSNSNLKFDTGSSSSAITVTLTNPLTLGDTKPADSQTFSGQIYACLAKQSYTYVTFEVTTNKGVYTITSNATAIDCSNKDFVPVNINLNKADFAAIPEEPTAKTGWFRVESLDWLSAGDHVVITDATGAYVMKNVQKSNNRDGVAITVGTDGGHQKITSFNDDAQLFILEDGSSAGTLAFWCDNGDNPNKYIYAASSSSNYLRSQDALDGNASFTPVIASGTCALTATGSYTHNIMRLNGTLFSCYSSASYTGVSIYKYYGAWSGSTTCSTPTISQDGNTITITSTTTGANVYYTTDGTIPSSSSTLYSAPFDIDGPVTIKAIAIRTHYTDSGVASEDCTVRVATPVITGTGTGFTISCATPGATIYYETSTTDLISVDTPTTSSTTYSTTVPIAATTYVKAIAVKAGYTDSIVGTATCAYSAGSASTTFTFNTSDGLSALGITAPGTGTGTNLDDSASYTSDAITMTVAHGGTNTRIWNSSGTLSLRVYKNGGSLTFDAGSGKKITKVEFTATSLTMTASKGTLSAGIWTGENQTVTFTADANSTISTIKVTYSN